MQRWILARLRNRRFFSLAELNRAIRELVDQLNDRPMRGWGTTRRALFEQLDRPRTAVPAADTLRIRRLEALPGQPRLPRRDRQAFLLGAVPAAPRGSGGADHGEDGGDLPPRQAGRHPSAQPASVSTHHMADHMPSSHRRYRDWTHERIQREAAAIGHDTAALVEIVLRSRPHPEQGFRSCIGILGLANATAPNGWTPPAPRRWHSAPVPTVRSRRS